MNAAYCLHCQKLPEDNIHRIHHDTVYGMPILDENELFGKLILEINQAGLSWDTILKKEDNFRTAYSNFEINTIAKYSEKDFERLMQDAGIIRNRLKINAAIYNANRIIELQAEFGSFFNWIKIQNLTEINDWVKLFKKNFKFTGGEIVNEFLMTIGRHNLAHHESCYKFQDYQERKKVWGFD